MRSIKVFLVVLAGLILLSLALRLFIPLFIIIGVIGLFVMLGRRIKYHTLSRMRYKTQRPHQRQGPPWANIREPLVYERNNYAEPITDVDYIEVK